MSAKKQHKQIILIVGHGSPVDSANDSFETFVKNFQKNIPEQKVCYGYIELAQPRLAEALTQAAALSQKVLVLPLFLLAAGHLKKDISNAVAEARTRFPDVIFQLAPALGVHPNMIKLITKRLRAMTKKLAVPDSKISVLMVGRGSSDSDANSDFCRITRLLEDSVQYGKVVYGFIAVVKPQVEMVLKQLITRTTDIDSVIVIQPYLLFHGQLVNELHALAEEYTKLHLNRNIHVSAPLGEDTLIFDLLKRRGILHTLVHYD